MRGSGLLRRAVAGLVAVSVAGGGVLAVEVVAAAQEVDLPEWMQGVERESSADDPVSPPVVEPDVVATVESVPAEAGEFSWPEPGSDAVTLGDPGDGVPVEDAPLELAAASASVEGAELEVTVAGREAAERAGASGFVFEVDAVDGSLGELAESASSAGELPVDLRVDYSGFAEAFGGNYVDRLQVVALPPCALEQPQPEGCRIEGYEVPSHVDAEAGELVVDVDDLASLVSTDGLIVDAAASAEASGPELPAAEVAESAYTAVDEAVSNPAQAREGLDAWPEGASASSGGESESGIESLGGGGAAVFALTSGTSGETGDFGASSLSSSSSWQVAPGSGEFSWSYDMPVPAPSGGAAPSVGLSYSSGAVDGLTSGANTQSGQNGVGWSDFASAFVERRYGSCSHGSMGPNVRDLCWSGDNATISLNGRSSQLLAVDAARTKWRLASDPGWLVERLGAIPDEYWQVTTPDGTVYVFGTGYVRNSAPLPTQRATNSRWTVPVWSDDSNEPCRAAGNTVGACDMAWRWNLERVIDPHGIETNYFYETESNMYRTLGGWGSVDETYVRGGRLLRVEYGLTSWGHPQQGQPGRPAQGTVGFAAQFRCNTLDTACASTPPLRTNGHLYPDAPNDLICTGGGCTATAPTFFTTKRYSAVFSKVRVGGAEEYVDIWNLGSAFQDNGEGSRKMYLNTIQRVGASNGSLVPMPAVNMLGTWKSNRVDIDMANGKLPMQHQRLTTIVDEFGHQTLVDYGQKDACELTDAGPWDTNVEDCFPVYGREGTAPSAVFHKYLTTRVREVDPAGGSPTVETRYDYEGTPALRYAIDLFMPSRAWSWNDWRGYGSTVVTQGITKSRVRVFRGMKGDKVYASGQAWPTTPGGLRSVPALSDSLMAPSLPAEPDDAWLAGAVYSEQKLREMSQGFLLPMEGTIHSYTRITTAPPTWPPGVNYADWVGEDETYTFVREPTNSYQSTRVSTTFDPVTYQPISVLEHGDTAVTGDERCTKTTYTQNLTDWMVAYPTSTVSLAGNCSSNTVLERSETYYDGATSLTAAPTRGEATKQRIQLDASKWVDSAQVEFDDFGRVTSVTDARGKATTTVYDAPADGSMPAWQEVTNAANHTTRTSWNRRGQAIQITDPNNRVTDIFFDDFGNVTGTRNPSDQTSGDLSTWNIYYVSGDKSKPPIVRSRKLLESGSPDVYVDSWTLYDTFLRVRETHALEPGGKVIVARTSYNNQGQVFRVNAPKAFTGTPGVGYLGTAADNYTDYTYDELGRQVTATGKSPSDPNKWTATTGYGPNTVTKTPAVGGAVRTTFDGLGRVVTVEEQKGPQGGPASGWVTTAYTHDLADNLTSITDPVGAKLEYTYNQVGWQTTSDDPDGGSRTLTYDDNGNLVTSTDALGQVIWTAYDDLNRPTSRRVGSSTGTELVRWHYDATSTEKGLLDKTVRVTPTGEWVTDVAYDQFGRATHTSQSVPSGVPGLTGTYTTEVEYNAAGAITATEYPAIAGLPAERVETDYSTLGLPETMTGLDTYVWSTDYDDRGRLTHAYYGDEPAGSNPANAWMGRQWAYDGDDNLASVSTNVGGYNITNTFGFDDAGNLKTRTTDMGTQSWRECYVHDLRNRMTDAFTLPKTGDCATATTGQRGTGGGTPYNHTYSYDDAGRITTRTENGTTDTYTYPTGTNPGQVHAPLTVGTGPTIDQYTWNDNGALDQRTVDGDTEDLTWDIEGRLASITNTNTGGTETYTYDPSGQRLLRTTPSDRTLYIAGHEIKANPTGTTVTATRTYGFAGQLIATRTGTGPPEYLTSDQQGSVIASAPDGATSPDVSRSYNPYGKRRSGGELDSNRGWLGQVEDDTTDLAYLNARYYDPNIATFISPDPLYNLTNPQTLNPYTYGLNNPATMIDPSGLCSGPKPDGICVDEWRYDPYAITRSVVHAGTKPAADAARQKAAARSSGQYTQYRRPDTAAEKANAADAVVLLALARANPDPKFWEALSRAGSGDKLTVAGMLQVASMEDWSVTGSAVAAAGGYEKFMHNARLQNATARWEIRMAAFTTPWTAQDHASYRRMLELKAQGWKPSNIDSVRDGSKQWSNRLSAAALATAWMPGVSQVLGAGSVGLSLVGTVTECVGNGWGGSGKWQNCAASVAGTGIDAATFGYGAAPRTAAQQAGRGLISVTMDSFWLFANNPPPASDGVGCPHYAPGPEMGGGKGC